MEHESPLDQGSRPLAFYIIVDFQPSSFFLSLFLLLSSHLLAARLLSLPPFLVLIFCLEIVNLTLKPIVAKDMEQEQEEEEDLDQELMSAFEAQILGSNFLLFSTIPQLRHIWQNSILCKDIEYRK